MDNLMGSIGIGVIEGFFGPEWSWDDRASMCELIGSQGDGFYIYAPKRDSYLRKNWTQDHPKEVWSELVKLSSRCRGLNVNFGIGLSPFELHTNWSLATKQQLKDKLSKLEELDAQYLGLFFDDMMASPDLAEKQAEIVAYVKSLTNKTILFCPTFYSDDPILDKVFGKRPDNYLEYLGENISKDVMFFWTGNKVIPDSIQGGELDAVSRVMQRKPIIWENYFANDGPKNCKFLKLKPFAGRSPEAYLSSAGWAMNLMNQANLSKALYLSAARVLSEGLEPEQALRAALQGLAGSEFSQLVTNNESLFLKEGLDNIDSPMGLSIRNSLDQGNPYANDIVDWLDQKYVVGQECLTD